LEQAVTEIVTAHLRQAADRHSILEHPDAGMGAVLTGAVDTLIARLKAQPASLCAGLVGSGTLHHGQIGLCLDASALSGELAVPAHDLHPGLLSITAPFDLRRRGVETKIISGARQPAPDPYLRSMLIRAHGWIRELKAGTQLSRIARRDGVPESFIRTRAQIAFLSPRVQSAILKGTQPPELSLKRLVSVTLPLDWGEQERMFGFQEAGSNRYADTAP
jgi:hypothetical protein